MKIEELRKIAERISNLDCGDSSCLFSKQKGGMRTNGGCRCLNGRPTYGLHILANHADALLDVVEAAREALDKHWIQRYREKLVEAITRLESIE